MKKKSGRPKKEVRREIISSVRFSISEAFVIREKAAQAGLTFTSYIRSIAVSGEVKARFTDEERQLLKALSGMANNINQLTRLGHREGLLHAMLHFENYRNRIDELLKQFKYD